MKLAKLYNKAKNRCYELLILASVCRRMINQSLHDIRSRTVHQKFLRKNVKKSNRDEFRTQAIEWILELTNDSGGMAQAQFTCTTVIRRQSF